MRCGKICAAHCLPVAALLLEAALISGCARKKVKAPPVPAPLPAAAAISRTPPPGAPAGPVIERGPASWYGVPYHGRRAADGEIFDMEAMVAAHRTLPFQTWLRVRNLTNGKTVDVRIMDRGPFVRNRIIDLSHAAARQIDLIGPGVAEVELRVIAAAPVTVEAFAVQVGAFREKANADRSRDAMSRAYGSATIVERAGDPVLYRVLAGREPSPESAERLARRIRTEQNTPQAFIVRLDQ